MEEMFTRGWSELLARDSGPLHGRLLLQPLVATVLALRTGMRDAREGRRLFFWALVGDPQERQPLLGQLWRDVGKLFLVAALLDVVYQAVVLRWVYPMQTLLVATALAIVPYLVVRGLTNRITRYLREAQSMAQDTPQPAPDQMTLALERTYLAHERTLMAWTRTATSLITFGFTLYKFFEFLHERGEATRGQQLLGARTFGLLMIGVGVLTLIVASVQHHAQMRRLRAHYPDAPFSLALLLAGLIAVLGVLGFISGIV